jgi:twinkle protein
MEKNRACPECKKIGHDKDDDHLFLMLDNETWCCSKDYHEPYYERDGSPVSPRESKCLDDTPDLSELEAASIRGIPKEVIDKYGIKVEYDTTTGLPIKHWYPITTDHGKTIVSWKRRTLPKDFMVIPSISKDKVVDLFGMKSSPFSPDIILITEGELDACAAHTMLIGFRRLMCLSVPFGGNIKAILDNLDFIRGASRIVLCPDQDAVGEKMINKLSLIIPEMLIMRFSEKDACDMLLEGKQAEFKDAFTHAKIHKPTSIVSVTDIMDEALKPVEWGLSYPFKRLTELTYGLMERSIIGIGGGPGTGKTSFIKSLQSHLVFKHKQPIGIFALEERPSQTLRSLGGLVINKPVHLPDCIYDHKKLQEAINSFDGLVELYDRDNYRDWNDIEDTMVYMAHMGIKFMFIDPLSALTAHLSASDANSYLNNAMFTLSKLTQSLGITVFHVNHLNNPTGGKDHGAGGKVYGSQFTGSRAMWKFSTDMWGLERDQYAESDEERNRMKLVILKNRLSGVSGSVILQYHRDEGKLKEVPVHGAFMDLD